MTTGKMAAKPSERRDVVAGDSIYYTHPVHGMVHGEVHSVGQDGCRVRHERDGGGSDAVEWSAMLGHKLRKQRRFTLVNRGEDGAIVLDEDGKQAFLRNDATQAPEPMAKSHPAVASAHGDSDVRVLALELARVQLEQANLLAAAMDRVAAAVTLQAARLDQLIALQVAALNTGDLHAGSVFQGDHAAEGAAGPL